VHLTRRGFTGLLAAGPFSAVRAATGPGKRERMLAWLSGKPEAGYTPAAFFLHFSPEFKNGVPAARKHMEFFRHTDMDFVKIQFEQTYERQTFLRKPADWAKLELRKLDFYEPLLVTVRELVRQAKKEALILMTLYSPFMCAGHCSTLPVLREHLKENPEAVKKGLEILTESQMLFVRECIREGVDGFYMSTQGSETKQFADPAVFSRYVKPFDLVAMKEASALGVRAVALFVRAVLVSWRVRRWCRGQVCSRLFWCRCCGLSRCPFLHGRCLRCWLPGCGRRCRWWVRRERGFGGDTQAVPSHGAALHGPFEDTGRDTRFRECPFPAPAEAGGDAGVPAGSALFGTPSPAGGRFKRQN